MPEGFRGMLANIWEQDGQASGEWRVAAGEVQHDIVAQHLCEEVRRYDIRGGRSMRLTVQLPHHLVMVGSQFNKLVKREVEWNSLVTRSVMPPAELLHMRTCLDKPCYDRNTPDAALVSRESTGMLTQLQIFQGLSPLFHVMKSAALALSMHARAGTDSPLLRLSPDLVAKIFDSVELLKLEHALMCESPESLADQLKAPAASHSKSAGAAVKMLKAYRAQEDYIDVSARDLKSVANTAFAGKRFAVAVVLYAQALKVVGAHLRVGKTTHTLQLTSTTCVWPGARVRFAKLLKTGPGVSKQHHDSLL